MTRCLPIFLLLILFACKSDDDTPPEETPTCPTQAFSGPRNFKMGFTTWPYAATFEAIDSTYAFIGRNADLVAEHLDESIPWSAWINGTPLPDDFVNGIAYKASLRPPGHELLLSVSLLNIDRSDLMDDIDGEVPAHTALNDAHIEDAYFLHVSYLVEAFDPDYLVLAIECNQLYRRAPEKWPAYKSLMANIRARVQEAFPGIPLSESFTLHDWVIPKPGSPDDFIEEIAAYGDNFDFAAISFYPFLEGFSTQMDYDFAFDFLYDHVSRPIAFVETAHPTDPVVIPGLGVNIPIGPCEQEAYLGTLLREAQAHEFLFVNWWCFADYNALFELFPPETQDLGLIWINTGLINENGVEKRALQTWRAALEAI
jgi:hypothetical protein